MSRYIIGIDEAGRGPLAGPVTLGAVLIPEEQYDILQETIPGIKDSKQLSKRKREVWFSWLQKNAHCQYVHSSVSADVIDQIGISKSIKRAMSRILVRSGVDPETTTILLDGSLYAPEVFYNQQTIIRGDEVEPIISLASICAKVIRDRKMIRLAKRYPQYHFEQHKGYGTREHYRCIREFGLTPVHRKTFLRNL